jgi:PAS domain S-box-containing protein
MLREGCSGPTAWPSPCSRVRSPLRLGNAAGVSGLDLVHPEDLELALRSLTSVQDKDVGAPIEIRLRTSNGWRLTELVGAPLPWLEDGAVLLTIRDLTQRRRFELVHDHDARLRSLVHNSAAITMLVSPDGCLESVSGAVTRQLGHDPEVIEGRPLSELVPEAHHHVLEGAFERASRGASVAGPVTVSLPMIRHGNTDTLPFELSFVNLIDDPTVGGYVVTGHDVTERRVADLELRTARSLVEAILDATADGILVVGTDGRVVGCNQRLVEMWHLDHSELAGADHTSLSTAVREQMVRPVGAVSTIERILGCQEGESSEVLELEDGRAFEGTSKPQTVDGTVVGRVWSFRDVTDRNPPEGRPSVESLHESLA